MKKIIQISIALYILIAGALFLGINVFIQKKDQRLRNELGKEISAVFGDRTRILDVDYSNQTVVSQRVQIPKKPEKGRTSHYEERLKKWNGKYEDITSLYITVNRYYSAAGDTFNREDGWNLKVLEFKNGMVSQYTLFPYAIGYADSNLSYAKKPVQEAVEDAFAYLTSDRNDSQTEIFRKGLVDEMWENIRISNRYYTLAKDSVSRILLKGDRLPRQSSKAKQYSSRQLPVYYTSISFDRYKVFIGATQPETWTVTKLPSDPDLRERNLLYLLCFLVLTAAVVLTDLRLYRKHAA